MSTEALKQVEDALAAGDIAALQALTKGPKAVKKAAKKALHRLRSQGVTVPKQRAASAFSLGKEQLETLSGAWMGPPDGDGYVYVVLGWADEDVCGAWIGHVGGGQGVRNDARFVPTSRSGWRRLTKELGAADGLAPVPFTAAYGLAAEGVATLRKLSGKDAPDWKAFSAAVPDGTKRTAELVDPLAGVTAAEGELTGEALKAFAGPYWEADPDTLIEASQEILESAGSQLELTPAQEKERQEDLEKRCGDALFDNDKVRDAWTRRATRLALWAKAHGDDALASEAAQLAGLLSAGASGAEVPFIRWAAFQITLRALAEAAGQVQHEHDQAYAHQDHYKVEHDHGHGHVHGPHCNHD